MEEKSLFVKCECTTHALEIVKVEDDTSFEVSIWFFGIDAKIQGLFEKFRWCWRIITTGNPWADQIILSQEHALDLAHFIIVNSSQRGI